MDLFHSHGQDSGNHAGRIHGNEYQRRIVVGQLTGPAGNDQCPDHIEQLARDDAEDQNGAGGSAPISAAKR